MVAKIKQQTMAKTCGGGRQTLELTPKKSAAASATSGVKPHDQRKLAARQAGLKKAKQAQQQAATARNVEKNAGSLALRSRDLTKKNLDAKLAHWYENDPGMYEYVAKVVANGLLEQDYKASLEDASDNRLIAKAGKPCFTDGAKTWRGLKVEPAKQILSALLAPGDPTSVLD